MNNLKYVLQHWLAVAGTSADMRKSCLQFIEQDIDRASSFNPFTHVYQYDLGFQPELQVSIAMKFNTR